MPSKNLSKKKRGRPPMKQAAPKKATKKKTTAKPVQKPAVKKKVVAKPKAFQAAPVKKKSAEPTEWTQYDVLKQLDQVYIKLDLLILRQTELPKLNEPYAAQVIDFGTKAEFAVRSLFDTIKLGAEDLINQKNKAKLLARAGIGEVQVGEGDNEGSITVRPSFRTSGGILLGQASEPESQSTH